MSHLINSLRDAYRKHVAYEETVEAIRNMPLDVALDLDVDRSQAREIAHKAVYGY